MKKNKTFFKLVIRVRTRGGFVPDRWFSPTPLSSFKTLCTTPSSEKDEIADVAPEICRRHWSLEATIMDGTRFLDGFGTSSGSVEARGASCGRTEHDKAPPVGDNFDRVIHLSVRFSPAPYHIATCLSWEKQTVRLGTRVCLLQKKTSNDAQ